MRLKLSILIPIYLITLVACHQQPTLTTTTHVVEPSITGMVIPEIDQRTVDTIRQSMVMFLKSNPYTEFETGNQLLLYLASSGEFSSAEITLSSKEVYQVDVLYAFVLMSNERVFAVPIVIGMTQPDGQYAYFSEKFAFDATGGVVSTSVDRDTALADARQRLTRGRIFRLIAYGMVSPQELLWDQCRSKSFMPEDVCQVGEAVEQLHPGATKLFVLRTADQFPDDWLLVGWVFQEFAVEELAPGVSPDVALPTP